MLDPVRHAPVLDRRAQPDAMDTRAMPSRRSIVSTFSGRLVTSWYVWRGVARMLSKASARHASGAASCQKSDIE